ncbi:histidinol-phosphatase [Sphingomonas profundi]|uniref:histidinol-phosphatase n=1 Tax=Alterirhizorhabdus profundi TaxID=2681549 RepID=UPI0012E88AC3|nr:histidinol-phosphatase [Sphingomonas profundi]
MTDADIALAHRLADAAGAAIRPFFRAAFAMEAKADASPVTQADRAAEAAIRAILAAERPADGIVGEEYGSEREDAERVWVLDPIDGTRSFIAGRPIFGTLIALMEGGRPVLGVIDQPIGGERWIGAHGRPTLLNGAPARARACARLADAHLATTGPRYFAAGQAAAFDRVGDAARDILWGGDCYNYALLASGHLDLVIEAGLKLYDLAALVPVVEGAGGRMRDWRGAPLDAASDGRVIAAGDAAVMDEALALLE